jgi:hypothetical protein
MLEIDLQKLAAQSPDHGLENLDIDIWAGVAMRERAKALSRRLVASQVLVLTCALIGSVAAGLHWSAAAPADDLGVFSPHSPWAVSTRIDGSAGQ